MIDVKVEKVVGWLWRGVAFFTAANLLFILLHRGFGRDWLLGLKPAFRTDHEQNLPTWFSVCVLFVGALLLVAVTLEERRRRSRYEFHWFALGLLFFSFSLDELIELHEGWGFVVRYLLPAGIEYRAWNLFYVLPLLFFARFFWPFWKSLDPSTSRGLCRAGAIYIGGAFGVETIENLFWIQSRNPTIFTDLTTSVEEAMEMSGAVVLIQTLLERLSNGKELTILIESSGDRRALDLPSGESETISPDPVCATR